MSLKAELETWAAALKAYDEEDFEKALDLFSRIADSSKILTNMGLIYATLGEHEAAVEQFIAATQLDQYLAVAYFQCGVSNFLLGRYDLAFKDFEEALLFLRGNQAINYEQIGLKFKLYSAEVLFNKGLAQIYMGRVAEGLQDMEEARREKATEEHSVIDDAIQDRGEGYTVFSIPVGVLYRPSENKLKNAKAKDYMGKAKLVAASDANDAFTEFSGIARLRQGITPTGVLVDTPPSLDRSVTVPNLPPKREDDMPRPTNLSRSKTTIQVDPNARDRIAGLRPGGAPSPTGAPAPAPAPAPLGRSNTMGTRPGIGGAGPARALSVKKPQAAASPRSPEEGAPSPPAKGAAAGGGGRLTEFYDDYIDSYGGEEAPPPPPPLPAGPERVAAWARNNANPTNPPPAAPSRMASTRGPPPSAYAASSYGSSSGGLRRKVTRRGTTRSRAPSQYTYEEEEEGYVSGDYEDGPFELVKIRVKLHYQDDVRGMALTPETPFDEFMDRVCQKFGKAMGGLGMKFKDEDGGKVSLRDDSDYELAIETARESAKGKPEGKLEIWCTDV
ncbi:hypothetical protein GLOTRDRAFT_121364 [Gloeophyllum trabeum ATCC 11539]|uniref:PB1 domain-containing protein n=1 Tax=Gloeophyllum trabeum (strain ATCC 11539 / FP-39264 / Madison 617) TaxID=670483 RepID=S7RQ35_GLOTA|nr:uncharacterized protein GLOTRDRAFT_121364 [Gloeophyllum trabeum ATCC 11539]EPQ54994.1 hypothetical protein GLOTRDRAFT_121364 [Gloeophyllum trabeum ATCC 11539]